MGWCQLRQVPIHPELVAQLWCHHWTARPPRLPVLTAPGSPASAASPPTNRQLNLETILPQS
jgi:hypothetical protein